MMLFVPPRHGKSELVSRRLPAFIFGRDPTVQIINTSYSADLAAAMNVDVQRIIESPEYQELFPHVKLAAMERYGFTRYAQKSTLFEIVGYGGSMRSAGVGGGITGRGADIAIVDDPIKNRQEAESKTIRDKVFDWFVSTLYTRLEKDGCILIVMTRWHEDDLAGRLLRLAEEDPNADQWYVINYPAIYDENLPNLDPTDPRQHGEPLWPEKYDLKTLQKTKATIGTYEWNALYQQSPSPPEGSIIKRHWFRFYETPPSRFDEIIMSWDMSFEDADDSSYVVGQVWGRLGADKYLLDQLRERMDFVQTVAAFRMMCAKWPMARRKLIEKKANGAAVISTLKHEISGIIAITPEGSKEARAHAVSADVEAGNVYLPVNQPWVKDFLDEVTSFPNGTHDDQVDGMTQALLYFNDDSRRLRSTLRKSDLGL